MSRRILLSPSRVAMSLPGFDVVVATGEQQLAVDSNWGVEVRPILVTTILNRSVNQGITVSFPAQPFVPVGQVHTFDNDGTTFEVPWIRPSSPSFFGGSTDYWQHAWQWTMFPDHMNIISPGGYNADWVAVPRNWLIVIWPTG